MANYAETKYTGTFNGIEAAATFIHDTLEAIDTTKTIRLCQIIPTASGMVMAVVIADT